MSHLLLLRQAENLIYTFIFFGPNGSVSFQLNIRETSINDTRCDLRVVEICACLVFFYFTMTVPLFGRLKHNPSWNTPGADVPLEVC